MIFIYEQVGLRIYEQFLPSGIVCSYHGDSFSTVTAPVAKVS